MGGRDVTRMADGPQSTYTHTQTRQIHRYKKWGSLGTTHLSFSVRRAARTSLENCLSSFLPSLFFFGLVRIVLFRFPSRSLPLTSASLGLVAIYDGPKHSDRLRN